MGQKDSYAVVLCGRSEQAPTQTFFLSFEHILNLKQKCVTTKLQLWWLTMAQECAKQGLPVMTVQEGYLDPEVPHRARNRYQLGRHGEDLASHFLQRAQSRPRRAPSPPD